MIKPKVVFLAHPLRGDTKANLKAAKEWYRFVAENVPDVVPVMNWVIECEIFDDADENQRKRGIQHNLALVARCDELWYLGTDVEGPSPGMLEEGGYAKRESKLVFDFTGTGPSEFLAKVMRNRLGGLPK